MRRAVISDYIINLLAYSAWLPGLLLGRPSLGILAVTLTDIMAAFIPLYSTFLWTSVLAVIYIGYRAALPKPLPGIPYDQDAARKLFGDVPEMMSYVRRTKRIFVRLFMSSPSGHQSLEVTVLTPYSAGSHP